MKLSETASGGTHRIDKEQGIIHNVKILGLKSRNGYRYAESAVKQAASLYEGVACYVDHWRKADDRPTRDHFGELRNIRFVEGQGLFGDLHYLTTHPETATILERAEKMPNQFGLSHVADGDKKNEGGEVVVERITAVESVDIVSRPATNNSIFESEQPAMPKKTIKQILRECTKKTKFRKLLESAVEDELVEEELSVDAPEQASPEEQIKAGLIAAIMSKIESASAEELQKVLDVFGLDDSLSAALSGGSTETSESETEEEKKVEESFRRLRQQMALMESKNLLLENNCEARPEWIRALANEPNDRDRRKLLESLPRRSNSANRPTHSPSRFSESFSGGGSGGSSEYDGLSETVKLY